MNIKLQKSLKELVSLPLADKILYLEEFLFYLTLTARGIWSDEAATDSEKLAALKWLNELAHRIWSLRADLKKEIDDDSVNRLYEHMKFYAEQSELLRTHLVPTALGAFERFKDKQKG